MTDIPPETTPCVIAIVEDEEDFRTEVAAFLEANGFSVWQADSAESFCRKIITTHADLVIIDLGLPGEDGLSLISYLNKTGDLPLVALTACGSVSERIAGLEAGADYYFGLVSRIGGRIMAQANLQVYDTRLFLSILQF